MWKASCTSRRSCRGFVSSQRHGFAMPKEQKPDPSPVLNPWPNVSSALAMSEKQRHCWDYVAVSIRQRPSRSSEPTWPPADSRIQGIQHDISPVALFPSCLIERPTSASETNQKQIFPSATPGNLHRPQRIRLTNNCHSGAILSYTGCHSTSPHSFGRRPALKPRSKANRAAPLAPSPESQNLSALLWFQGCPPTHTHTHHSNRGINQRHQHNSARPSCRHWLMLP